MSDNELNAPRKRRKGQAETPVETVNTVEEKKPEPEEETPDQIMDRISPPGASREFYRIKFQKDIWM